MLSRTNRISRASDFRTTVRTGRKFATAHSVVYVAGTANTAPARFGFIVAKSVGNSVTRHFVTRRLRAVGHDLLPAHSSGLDVIVRALPGSDEVEWSTLRAEIAGALEKASTPGAARARNVESGVGA